MWGPSWKCWKCSECVVGCACKRETLWTAVDIRYRITGRLIRHFATPLNPMLHHHTLTYNNNLGDLVNHSLCQRAVNYRGPGPAV